LVLASAHDFVPEAFDFGNFIVLLSHSKRKTSKLNKLILIFTNLKHKTKNHPKQTTGRVD